jgi:hypothetical protein
MNQQLPLVSAILSSLDDLGNSVRADKVGTPEVVFNNM